MSNIDWVKWLPTPKWWAATIPAAGTLIAMFWLGDGVNTDDEKLAVISIVVQRLAAYVIPNDGGVTMDRMKQKFKSKRGQIEPISLLVYLLVFIIIVVVLVYVLRALL